MNRDGRLYIASGFLLGYYLLVAALLFYPVPEANLDLINAAMLTLGPPVGLIVGAVFRTDAKDEQATANTGKALDAIAAAQAAPSHVDNVAVTGEHVTVEEAR